MDEKQIIQDFPIFSQTDRNGKTLCYLDSAATTQKPLSVLEAMDTYYKTYNANIHRGVYHISELATEAHETTRYGIILSIAKTMAYNRSFLLCFYEASPKLYFETLIGQIEASNTVKPLASVPPEVYYTFASKAWVAIGVLTEWLQRSCDLSSEKISKMIDSMIA